jgi:hypothetical protein
MSGPRTPLIAVGAALLAVLCGCGQTAVIRRSRTICVGLTEYRLAPQSMQISQGPVTIFVHNYGRLTHNLVISRSGRARASSRPVWPGQTAELALTLTPGSYLISSTVLSDQALGEYGTLRVTS